MWENAVLLTVKMFTAYFVKIIDNCSVLCCWCCCCCCFQYFCSTTLFFWTSCILGCRHLNCTFTQLLWLILGLFAGTSSADDDVYSYEDIVSCVNLYYCLCALFIIIIRRHCWKWFCLLWHVTIAWSVCLSMCMSSVTLMHPAKAVGQNEMPLTSLITALLVCS